MALLSFLPLIVDNNNYVHALINVMCVHMIYINLSTIFYTHAEHSLTETIYVWY